MLDGGCRILGLRNHDLFSGEQAEMIALTTTAHRQAPGIHAWHDHIGGQNLHWCQERDRGRLGIWSGKQKSAAAVIGARHPAAPAQSAPDYETFNIVNLRSSKQDVGNLQKRCWMSITH